MTSEKILDMYSTYSACSPGIDGGSLHFFLARVGTHGRLPIPPRLIQLLLSTEAIFQFCHCLEVDTAAGNKIQCSRTS